MSSKQIVRNVRGAATKEFIRRLESLAYSRGRWEVFSDWTYMASAAIYNSFKKDPEVEAEYLRIVAHYSKEEASLMAEMLALVTDALTSSPRDVVGEIYEGAMLANSNHGQFFTPFSVSQLMAHTEFDGMDPAPGRIVSVSDPACGAGGMLVASAVALQDKGVNYQQWAFFHGQDIDPLCCRMAYIQLSLLGCPAVIVCGDTLKNEKRWAWETPMYAMSLMGYRLAAQRRREAGGIAPAPAPVSAPPADAVVIKAGPQIDLFGEAV